MANPSSGNGQHTPGETGVQPSALPGNERVLPSESTEEARSSAARVRPGRGRVQRDDTVRTRTEPVRSLIQDLYTAVVNKRVAPPDDEETRFNCPYLWELLTVDRYKDGKDRFLAEITIKRVGGGYVAEVRDHETGQAKQAMALRLHDVFIMLEAALANVESPWRAFKSFLNPKGLERHLPKKT